MAAVAQELEASVNTFVALADHGAGFCLSRDG